MSSLGAVDTTDLLVSAMKVCRERHRYIASNIANVDTPNYTPRELDFGKALEAAVGGRGLVSLRKTRPAHFTAGGTGSGPERAAFSSKNDLNKVDVEDQVAKLADNTSQFIVFSSLLNKRFEQIKNLISTIR